MCEIRLNEVTVNANTKGIKKQPGTAPPVDLSKAGSGAALALHPGAVNKVEVVYLNTDKRYFLLACLVEAFSIKQTVEKIKNAPSRPKDAVIADSEQSLRHSFLHIGSADIATSNSCEDEQRRGCRGYSSRLDSQGPSKLC